MGAALLPDPLWDLVEPFLPTPPHRPKGGWPRVSDHACLTAILFVRRSGIPWQMLPQELGCGSGMTCWRRVRDWQRAGVWDLIHFALLDWLARDDQIDWSRAVVDSCSIRADGGDQTGPNPTDRAKRWSKRHLICDGRCVPLAVRRTDHVCGRRARHWRYESVAAFWLRLDEARTRDAVAEALPKPGHRLVDAPIEVDVRVRSPDAVAQVLPGDDAARREHERRENPQHLAVRTRSARPRFRSSDDRQSSSKSANLNTPFIAHRTPRGRP
jgi:transposase